MQISDLNISNELDQNALSVVNGGGIVGRRYLGSHMSSSNWRYHGERALAFLGNVYIRGKGWTRKFKSVRTYSRTQVLKAFYHVYVR